jgi:hypothetical protein
MLGQRRTTAAVPVYAAAGTATDPFTLALGDCVHRVREGEVDPRCRFFRPLDEMDFGQKHCDAKCSELTAGYLTSHAPGH